ncbi:MAG: HEPN domain-containing protein [Ignavibacteriae bacterium]|nr:MAG: HEPN domain-containing protein [Ignavibacteriota bacterium]
MDGYSEQLFKIAQHDLIASVVLYDNRLYLQSIYMFQQAVEKAVKYFALFFEIFKPQELFDKIRHKPLKLFIYAIDEQIRHFKKFIELEKDQVIGGAELFSDFDMKEYLSKLVKNKEAIETLSKQDIQRDKNLIIDIYNQIIEAYNLKLPFRNSKKK